MKKFLVVLVAVMLLAPVAGAWTLGSDLVYSVEIRNNTGSASSYVVPITTIRPKVDKLVGYEVMPIDGHANAECFVGIFDDTTVAMVGEILGEKESDNNGSIGEAWPRGKKIVNGIVTRQGAYTDLILYFIRK